MFEHYRLERRGDSYEIILFLSPEGEEFARELGDEQDGGTSRLTDKVRDFVQEHVPKLRVTSAKVMLGSMLLTTLVLGVGHAMATEAPQQGVQIATPAPVTDLNKLAYVVTGTGQPGATVTVRAEDEQGRVVSTTGPIGVDGQYAVGLDVSTLANGTLRVTAHLGSVESGALSSTTVTKQTRPLGTKTTLDQPDRMHIWGADNPRDL